MKICPVCQASAFDDAQRCFGCLSLFVPSEPKDETLHQENVFEECSDYGMQTEYPLPTVREENKTNSYGEPKQREQMLEEQPQKWVETACQVVPTPQAASLQISIHLNLEDCLKMLQLSSQS